MKKHLLVAVVILVVQSNCFAQYSRYIIQLKDKATTPYLITDPSKFLGQRAIERRIRYNIPIDSTDLPVTPAYIDSIRLSGNVTILNVSKWLNQVCIQTTDAQALAIINSFPFVKATGPIAARQQVTSAPVNKHEKNPGTTVPVIALRPQSPADVFNYGLAYPQVHLHNAEFLHNLGFKGEGMQLAIMDAGFYHYQTLPTFDSIRNNNQVLQTWDFVNNEASVNEDHPHGMNCFSTIAANLPGSFVGTAPKTGFYLFRTEDAFSEYPVEEQNFAAAAERADSLGADVFSVSLGYSLFDNSIFNHSYATMDGNTTIITRAADYAAKKGILVVAAAGNDGNATWHYITAPADADSVLTVGAVNANGQAAGFSGYGPTADGRTKPDVAAVGQGAVIANQVTGAPSYNNGTSFSCPIMAGISTCLWQAFPEVNNMSIVDVLRKSANKYNAPDDRTGFGIPDAKKAFVLLLKKLYTQQIDVDNSCKAIINWSVKAATNMSISIERKLPAESAYITIGTQQFTGAFTSRNYSYADDLTTLSPGVKIQYRIKMSIASDTSFYFDSAVVDYSTSCGPLKENISISPNPVQDDLKIVITRNDPAKIAVIIYSATGHLVYKKTQQVTGSVALSIPLKQFAHGIYVVNIYIDDKKQISKKILR